MRNRSSFAVEEGMFYFTKEYWLLTVKKKKKKKGIIRK